jgi:pyrophosphatase PpaX
MSLTKKALLFDLDGTLVDTKELILASFRHATREVLGETLPDAAVRPYIGIPLVYQMQALAPDHVDEIVAVYRAHNAKVHDELIQYFEGTREMLDELRSEGRRLAVVTSKRNEVALRGLKRFDLAEYFEFIIGSDDTTLHKPKPEPLLIAAKRMGISPDDCVYVGDSPFDMRAAVAANITALAVLWGMFSQKDLEEAGAQYEANSPSELPTVIRRIEADR